MKHIYTFSFFFFAIFLAGCSTSNVEHKVDPLTKEEYRIARNVLVAVENCDEGELILKYVGSNPRSIQAVLNIIHRDKKDYMHNSEEELHLCIDSTVFPLEILHSLKKPQEEVKNYHVALPSGGSLMLGNVKDVTKRKISFLLSEDQIEKIGRAKTVHFKIILPLAQNKSLVAGYPIILQLSKESIVAIQQGLTKKSDISKYKTSGEMQ